MIKKSSRNLLMLYTLMLFGIFILSACAPPFFDIPKEDSYLVAKEKYEKQTPPPKDYPIASPTNLPSECSVYEEQISRYYLPLTEGWTREDCIEYGLSKALPVDISSDLAKEIGFVCMDINSDGISELLIGSTNPDYPVVLELWSIVNENPKLLAQADETSRYYLRYSQETERYIWENCTGSMNEENAFFFFTFNGRYMDYLWDYFLDLDTLEQAEMRKLVSEGSGVRIAPNYFPYAELSCE